MQQRCLVHYVSSFNGDVEGKHYENSKIHYFLPVKDEGGHKSVISKGTYDLQLQFDCTKLPAIYDVDFAMVPKGKSVELVPVRAKFVKQVNIFDEK